MGRKGERRTSVAETTAAGFVERIAAIGDVTTRKMFGGVGVFEAGVMFGIVDSRGGIFLRHGPRNEALFTAAGSERHGKMPYYSVPQEILDDDAALLLWAETAAEAARAAKK